MNMSVNEGKMTSNAITNYLNQNDFEFINEDIVGLFEDTFEGLERVSKNCKRVKNLLSGRSS